MRVCIAAADGYQFVELENPVGIENAKYDATDFVDGADISRRLQDNGPSTGDDFTPGLDDVLFFQCAEYLLWLHAEF